MRAALILIAGCLTCAGCARPEAVRLTAGSAIPVATRLASQLPDLEARMRLQLGAQTRYAGIKAQSIALVHGETLRQEAVWRLGGSADDKQRLSTLTILRERDAAVIADPLQAFGGTKVPDPPDIKIPLVNLRASIVTLNSLRGTTRMNLSDFLMLAGDINDEMQRIKAEAAAKPTQP